jgi:hypothetical protein
MLLHWIKRTDAYSSATMLEGHVGSSGPIPRRLPSSPVPHPTVVKDVLLQYYTGTHRHHPLPSSPVSLPINRILHSSYRGADM